VIDRVDRPSTGLCLEGFGECLEAQLVGVTKSFPGYDFKLLDNMMIFDPKVITNPAGQRSVDWLKTLKPEFVKMDVPTFKQ